jgi:hypothetical protein
VTLQEARDALGRMGWDARPEGRSYLVFRPDVRRPDREPFVVRTLDDAVGRVRRRLADVAVSVSLGAAASDRQLVLPL